MRTITSKNDNAAAAACKRKLCCSVHVKEDIEIDDVTKSDEQI